MTNHIESQIRHLTSVIQPLESAGSKPLEYTRIELSDAIIDRIIYYAENIRDSQFAIGDILVMLVDATDDYKKEVINYLAGKTGISAGMLYDYEATARRWTLDYRLQYPSLDWTIYRNSDPVKDKELLDEALDNKYNATRFKERKYPALLKPDNLIRMSLSYLNKIDNISDEYKELLQEIKERLDKLLKHLVV